MANSSIALTSLDFDSLRESFKTFLRQQDQFKDYDYESSNISVLLDLLAYNSYQNSFYLNMIGNEMFLDTAVLRDSVVSHAKELNYVPRSFRSATATISAIITSANTAKTNVVIPRGTPFSTRIGSRNFIFTTDENVVITSANNIYSTELILYEGDFVTDTYVVNYQNPEHYVINNKTVDLSSLKVSVIEDNGANVLTYTRATSLFDLTASSKSFFVQAYQNETYEVVFGDGVIGRRPKNNAVVIMEYRICNGELANGARTFLAAQSIDGESNVAISLVSVSSGGAVFESIDSIKYNAPRAFTTQERAVTAEDYENLLKANFPEINAVSAYGGEDAVPPQFGRVFISVDLNDVDGLPKSKEQQYSSFLKTRSSVALEPIFVNPEYTYLGVTTTVNYNINKTAINPQDISTLVLSSILDYASVNLNNFARTFRYSRFVKQIDDSENSIISNETDLVLIKHVTPVLNSAQNINVKFEVPLLNTVPGIAEVHSAADVHAISSTSFVYKGTTCYFEDNGDGILRVVAREGDQHKTVGIIGTVDYDTGTVVINNFTITSFSGSYVKVYGIPRSKDISVTKNVILNILENDVTITVVQTRE